MNTFVTARKLRVAAGLLVAVSAFVVVIALVPSAIPAAALPEVVPVSNGEGDTGMLPTFEVRVDDPPFVITTERTPVEPPGCVVTTQKDMKQSVVIQSDLGEFTVDRETIIHSATCIQADAGAQVAKTNVVVSTIICMTPLGGDGDNRTVEEILTQLSTECKIHQIQANNG